MAFLDSNGLKLLTAQIAETYGTKSDLSALETKISACATKAELADTVKLSALSGLLTFDEASKNFLSIAEAGNFVEEYRLADFAENSALENFLTVDEASKFAEKSELDELTAYFQKSITVETRGDKIFAVMATADGKTYEFPVAEV